MHDGEPFVRTALLEHPAPDRVRPRADRRRRPLDGRHGRDARGARRPAAARAPQRRAARACRIAQSRRSTRRAGATSLGWTPTTSRFRDWLERSVALLDSRPELGLVGAGVLDIEEDGDLRELHLHDAGRAALRWRALFSAPVFHNTVVLRARSARGARAPVRRVVRRVARTTTSGRALLDVAEGDCVEAPLVLHRLHPQQASRRRGDLQRDLADDDLAAADRRGRARALGAACAARPAGLARRPRSTRADVEAAALAFVELEQTFEAEQRFWTTSSGSCAQRPPARSARLAAHARGDSRRRRIWARPLRLDPLLPAHAAARRARRRALSKSARRDAADLLRTLAAAPDAPPIRVAAVFPEPTPYRAPLLDRVAALPEIDLTVVYAAGTVAGRTWRVEPKHRAVFLRGLRVPGADARAAPRLSR